MDDQLQTTDLQVSNGVIQADQANKVIYTAQDQVLKEFTKIMKKWHPQVDLNTTPLSFVHEQMSVKNVTFQIVKISEKGVVKIKFSEPIL